jgi:hypothetical protein
MLFGIIKTTNLLQYNTYNSFNQRISFYLVLLCQIKINKKKDFLKTGYKPLKAFLSCVSLVK